MLRLFVNPADYGRVMDLARNCETTIGRYDEDRWERGLLAIFGNTPASLNMLKSIKKHAGVGEPFQIVIIMGQYSPYFG